MASMISQASLEQGLISIMQLFLVVQKSKKSITVLGPPHTKAAASGFTAAAQSTAGLQAHPGHLAKLASKHQGMQLPLAFSLPNAYDTIILWPQRE